METTAKGFSATPAKLRSGAWGARVEGAPGVGDVVTVTTKGGKSWEARVTRVLWAADGVALCATESLDRPVPRRSGGYSSRRYYARRPRGRCEDAPCCGCCDVYGGAL